MATFTLNSVVYTIGSANAAATDLTAANALMDQIDAIISGWASAYASDGAGFYKQGGSAGSVAAGGPLGLLMVRLKQAQAALQNLTHG
jgi:hypothetical protein